MRRVETITFTVLEPGSVAAPYNKFWMVEDMNENETRQKQHYEKTVRPNIANNLHLQLQKNALCALHQRTLSPLRLLLSAIGEPIYTLTN